LADVLSGSMLPAWRRRRCGERASPAQIPLGLAAAVVDHYGARGDQVPHYVLPLFLAIAILIAGIMEAACCRAAAG
jgi:hypothetical protein